MKYDRMHTLYNQEQQDYLRQLFNDGKKHKEITQAFNDRFGTNLSIHNIFYALHWFGLYRSPCFKNTKAYGNKNRWKGVKPLGSERLDKDGYILVKVGFPRVEKRKHILVWEQVYGKIDTKKEVIVFLDGNKQNCELSNLHKMDRRLIGVYAKIVGCKDMTPDMRRLAIETANLWVKASDKKSIKFFRKKELCKKVWKLHKKGYNRSEIGKEVGLSTSCVSHHIRRGNIIWGG